MLYSKHPETISGNKSESNEIKKPVNNWTTINIKKFKLNTNIVV